MQRTLMQTTLLRFPTVVPAGQFNVSSVAPPLALACLAAYLQKHGFPVTVIDSVGEAPGNIGRGRGKGPGFRGISAEEIIKKIPPEVNVLGVSCMFSSEWPFDRELIKTIKAAFPGVTIIAGGEHVSALPELVLAQAPGIDLAVIGEGEETCRELLTALSKGTALDNICGLAFRKNGSFFKTPPRRRLTAPDDLPLPAWDAVPLENYFKAGLSHGPYLGRTMPILTSRGCPYSCKFCSSAEMWGNHYVQRTPSDVVGEIALYIAKYGVQCVEFYDLSPVIRKAWLTDFCRLLLSGNIRVFWQMAAGTRFEALDEELLALAGSAGCRYLGFAPESGSPEVLEAADKKLNLAEFNKVVKLALRHRIGVKANLIIGFPEETRVQVLKTLLLQLRLALAGVDDAPVFRFSPYPGSAYFKTLLRQKAIPGLNDEYFNSLGLNLFLKNKNRYCRQVGPFELSLYQVFGTILFYAAHYLLHPLKLLKALLFWNSSGSVFEQRLKQNLKALLPGKRSGGGL